MNTTTTIPVSDQLAQLNSVKKPCPARHPFLKAFHLTSGQHWQVTAQIDGITYQDNYVRVVRNASGEAVNAVLFKQRPSGVFEQLFLYGAPKLGSYVPATSNLLDGAPIYVTVDTTTASHIAAATGSGAVAALHPQNLETVTLAMRKSYPNSLLRLALDWKDDGSGQNPRTLLAFRELSHKLQVPYVTSGDAISFAQLACVRGAEGIAKRLEAADTPAADVALSGASAQQSPIPEAPIAASFAQDGEGLLRDVVAAVRRAVVTSEASAIAIALWIMFTHVYRSFTIAPLLVLSSPEPRCGKTNALTLLLRLVATPLATSNVSESAIYRSIELWRPTLLIDEADTFMLGNKQMAGIINSGYKVAAGRVLRANKNGVESLNTFVPKAIALIGTLSEAVRDRAIMIRLARKHPSEEVLAVHPAGPDGLTMLHARIIRWANDIYATLPLVCVHRIDGINDRANDNAAPLLTIASACSEAWLNRAYAALEELAEPENSALSVSTQLLADIRAAFADSQQDQLPTAEILRHLHSNDEAPWPAYSRGCPITARDMAELLGRYGIKSFSKRVEDDKVVRAYARHQFADAFKRYLS